MRERGYGDIDRTITRKRVCLLESNYTVSTNLNACTINAMQRPSFAEHAISKSLSNKNAEGNRLCVVFTRRVTHRHGEG